MQNEKQEQEFYYNWNLALFISIVVILLKVYGTESIEDVSWWWLTICLWLPFPLSLIISLIRKFF